MSVQDVLEARLVCTATYFRYCSHGNSRLAHNPVINKILTFPTHPWDHTCPQPLESAVFSSPPASPFPWALPCRRAAFQLFLTVTSMFHSFHCRLLHWWFVTGWMRLQRAPRPWVRSFHWFGSRGTGRSTLTAHTELTGRVSDRVDSSVHCYIFIKLVLLWIICLQFIVLYLKKCLVR